MRLTFQAPRRAVCAIANDTIEKAMNDDYQFLGSHTAWSEHFSSRITLAPSRPIQMCERRGAVCYAQASGLGAAFVYSNFFFVMMKAVT